MMVQAGMAIEISPVVLESDTTVSIDGRKALKALLCHATSYTASLHAAFTPMPRAVIGRVRGTGPGVSFGAMVDAIQESFPTALHSPFEGSHSVAGGVLLPEQAQLDDRDDGFLFLRFDAHSRDLPMHTHEFSDRLIYVLKGRGFFHVTPEDSPSFDGRHIRHVPVRSRDVLLFKRGTLHTFSTGPDPLFLLSYHAPFIPLDSPRQYTLPDRIVLPAETADVAESRITCDPAWSRLA